MRVHRNPRKRLSKQPSPDNRRTALPEPEPDELDHLLYTLRDNLRRADAFITTGERQLEVSWSVEVDDDNDDDDDEDEEEEDDEDRDVQRRRMRVEYLVEGGKYAVRAALYTVQQIDAVLAARKRSA